MMDLLKGSNTLSISILVVSASLVVMTISKGLLCIMKYRSIASCLESSGTKCSMASLSSRITANLLTKTKALCRATKCSNTLTSARNRIVPPARFLRNILIRTTKPNSMMASLLTMRNYSWLLEKKRNSILMLIRSSTRKPMGKSRRRPASRTLSLNSTMKSQFPPKCTMYTKCLRN